MVRGISTGSVNLLKNRAELPVERCDISVVGVMWYFYIRLHYTVSNSLYPVLVFLSLSSNTVFQSLFYYLIIFIYSLGIFRDSSNDGIPLLQRLQIEHIHFFLSQLATATEIISTDLSLPLSYPFPSTPLAEIQALVGSPRLTATK